MFQPGQPHFIKPAGSSARVIDIVNSLNRTVGGTVNLTDPFTATGANNNTTSKTGGYRAPNTAFNASNNTGVVVNGVVPYMTYTTTSGSTPAAGLAANNPVISSWFVPSGVGTQGSQYTAFNTSSNTSLGTSTQNIDIAASTAVPLGTTVNTLRFNNNAKSWTLTVTPGDILTIGAGGILITGTYAGHSGVITGGTLEGGNPGAGSGNDLIVIDYDDPGNTPSPSFTIGSVIADNPTNGNTNGLATALTKSGIGTLILTSAANTYTGGTFLNGGITSIAGEGTTTGSLGAIPATPVSNNISFSGGTLQLAAGFNINPNRGITLLDQAAPLPPTGSTPAMAVSSPAPVR